MSEETDKTYRAYSSAALRDYLYRGFPQFTKERIARRLKVSVIAIGAGGDDQPLAERRWLRRPGQRADVLHHLWKEGRVPLSRPESGSARHLDRGRVRRGHGKIDLRPRLGIFKTLSLWRETS